MKASRLFAGVLLVVLASPAYAYLDPGTGSIIIQGLIAAVVGGLFFLRTWWSRIKAFFIRALSREPKEPRA